VTVRGDASQYTHTYGYDAQGDQTSESTPPMTTTLNGSTTTAPVTTTEGYDGDGNRVSTISANGNTTTLAYDHLGRQTSATLPPVTLYDGSATTPVERTGYDGDGNVARTTDATGATTTSVYDPLGRQTSTTNPVSGTATTRYNATEAVAAQDMAGNVTTSAYDGAGRLVQASDAVTGTTRYGYDAAGNTVAITAGDTSGAVTQLETRGYDAWDHAITDTMAAPASPALTTLTAYDRDGNVAQTEQPQGDTTYATYDLADQPAEELIYARPVGQAGSDGGGRWGRATGAGDEGGRRISRQEPRRVRPLLDPRWPFAEHLGGRTRELVHACNGRAQRLCEGRRPPTLDEKRTGHGEMDEQGRRIRRSAVQRAHCFGELPRRTRGLRGGDAPGGDGAVGRGDERLQGGDEGGAVVCALEGASRVDGLGGHAHLLSRGPARRRCRGRIMLHI